MRVVGLIVGILALVAAGTSATAHAAGAIDCPLRDQPYSSQSPLIDLLLKPEAVAVINRDAPGLIDSFWAGLKGTTVPSFGSRTT